MILRLTIAIAAAGTMLHILPAVGAAHAASLSGGLSLAVLGAPVSGSMEPVRSRRRRVPRPERPQARERIYIHEHYHYHYHNGDRDYFKRRRCGLRCWYRRIRRGYCGPGCDYYYERQYDRYYR